MEFKLFESLLTTLNEYSSNIDKRNHTYNMEGEHGMDQHRSVSFDGHYDQPDTIQVYGDTSVVINYVAHEMKWFDRRKDVSFIQGIDTLSIKSIDVNGKPLFYGNTLPSDDLTDWDGDPNGVAGLDDGANQSIRDWKDEGKNDLVAIYNHLIKAKPTLWNDVSKALLQTYNSLDNRPPQEV